MGLKRFRPYLPLLFILLCLFILPDGVSLSLRRVARAPLFPIDQTFSVMSRVVPYYFGKGARRELEEEVERLVLEKHLLINQVEHLSREAPDERWHAVRARVIHREPALWSHSLWIDLGSDHVDSIAKNSPVMSGVSVVGVVDYVGKDQSRVRLISDSGLHPSVRVFRGEVQNRELISHLKAFRERLSLRSDLSDMKINRLLSEVEEHFEKEEESLVLAKGELSGSLYPLWRSQSCLLRGMGFNYDYPDEYGHARDLRTGMVLEKPDLKAHPIVVPGDLLVTTGMDGVFPPGLRVAVVVSVEPLQEGSCYFELTARSTAGDLNDLQTLFVLPAEPSAAE